MDFWRRMLAGRPGIFEHRRIVGIAVLLALVISLPMLGTGIFLDDYGQRIKLLTGDDTS